jgi:hypothetical protein
VKRYNEPCPLRRHVKTCKFFGPGGPNVRLNACDCTFHVDGKHRCQRVRQSLKTRSGQLANRRLAALLRTIDAKLDEQDQTSTTAASGVRVRGSERTVRDAVDRFLRSHGEIDQDREFRGDIQYPTWRKYRTKLQLLVSFCDVEDISELSDVNIDVLEDFRRTRRVGLVTWKVELQALRTFSYTASAADGSRRTPQGNEGAAQHQAERGGSLHAFRREPYSGCL